MATHEAKPLNFDDFDSYAYLQKSYSSPRASSPTFHADSRRFVMQQVHRFYNELLPPLPADAALLEFGGGPVIAYLISAVPHVASIVFSDYCASGRAAVSDWVAGAPGAFDWTPFFDFVLGEFEHVSAADLRSASAARAAETRAKIRSVVASDANEEHPVGPGFDASFDVISISFCFESACKSHDMVVTVLRRLAKLLKPRGWLRINGVRGGSYYFVEGAKFFNLTQTAATMRASLTTAGFEVVDLQEMDLPKLCANADYSGMYHVAARLM